MCADWVGGDESSGCFVQISAARCVRGITPAGAGEGRRVWRALLGSGAPGVGAGMELSTRCGAERLVNAAVHICGNFHAPALSRKKKKAWGLLCFIVLF